MERYIGVDAHLKSCTIAVMSAAGRRLSEQRVETNGEALVAFVRGMAGRKHVCFEEGLNSEWLYEVLEPHVCEIVVVQPEKHQRRSKSDSADAWKLCDQIRKGNPSRVVYEAPKRFTALRQAVRGYGVVRRDQVRAKNRLKALLHSRGVRGMKQALYREDQRGPWLVKLPAHHRVLAELLAKELDALAPVVEQAEAWLDEEAKQIPLVRRLST